jgi:3-(methylthio)propionyl---CoA ligase
VIGEPWICPRLHKMPESERADGWSFTGDVATIDSDGYMQVMDRPKDVIKSGGEWRSSIELENLAMAHPEIVEAAVIGVAHPKWDERPLVLAVRRQGSRLKAQDLLAFCEGKRARAHLSSYRYS